MDTQLSEIYTKEGVDTFTSLGLALGVKDDIKSSHFQYFPKDKVAVIILGSFPKGHQYLDEELNIKFNIKEDILKRFNWSELKQNTSSLHPWWNWPLNYNQGLINIDTEIQTFTIKGVNKKYAIENNWTINEDIDYRSYIRGQKIVILTGIIGVIYTLAELFTMFVESEDFSQKYKSIIVTNLFQLFPELKTDDNEFKISSSTPLDTVKKFIKVMFIVLLKKEPNLINNMVKVNSREFSRTLFTVANPMNEIIDTIKLTLE